jgi:hypothetical protein
VPLRLAPATVGAFYLRKTAGNFAMFGAIRRASLWVNISEPYDESLTLGKVFDKRDFCGV